MGGVKVTSVFTDEALARMGKERADVMFEFSSTNEEVITMRELGMIITVEEVD